MNNMKPVFWTTQQQIENVPIHHGLNAWPNKNQRHDKGELIPLCALPDTHRVVSVELLGEMVKACEYAGWTIRAEELRAIIDNKGEK